jgi:hypothetical protein
MEEDMSVPSPLVVVPCDPRTAEALDRAARCLVSLIATAPTAEVVVIGDPAGDAGVVAQLQAVAGELGFGFGLCDLRRSFGAGVNPALEEARDDGRDAVLVAADVELSAPGWLDALVARRDTSRSRAAAVVGGRLLYPNGLIDHAGLQFSLLKHEFVESYRFGPASLREARTPRVCPVGPGLVLLRHQALAEVGMLDEDLPGLELVDFCLRTFAAGLECIYEPAAVGTRHGPAWPAPPTDAEKRRHLRVQHALLDRHPGRLTRWIAPVTA